jgi:hypothetical protein
MDEVGHDVVHSLARGLERIEGGGVLEVVLQAWEFLLGDLNQVREILARHVGFPFD